MTGNPMRAGMVLPGGTATEQLEQAILAEQAGWDGVFVWEAGYGVDAWTLLAAIAARTSRVRLGTMFTPSPRRRPWKVARQVATLDQISGGRAVLGVGIGAIGTGLPDTGELTDVRGRAERQDEGIHLIHAVGRGGLHLVVGDPLGDAPDPAARVRNVRERLTADPRPGPREPCPGGPARGLPGHAPAGLPT